MKWHPVGRSWPGLAQTLSIPQITTHQRIALTGRLIKHISLLGKYKKENKPRMVQFAAGDQASPSVAADAAAPDTSAAPVAVITTAGCSYCKRVKATLKDAGIHFQEFALTDDLEALAEVKRTTGQSTVPQVFIAGQLLGGSSEVDAALADGTLQTLIIKAEDAPALPEGVRKVLQGRQASPLDSTSGSTGSMQAQAAEALAREMLDGGIDSSTAPFALEDAAQWLVHEKGLTHSAAIEQLGDLQAAQRLTIAAGVDPKTPLKDVKETSRVLLRWVAQCPAPTEWDVPLNAQFVWFGPSRPAVQVSAELRQLTLTLFDRHLTVNGRRVNYRAMATDPVFLRFTTVAAELQGVRPEALSREESMCFWINLYNCAIVHATVVFGPASSTLERLRWFDAVGYVIGGQKFSCNDIEHGVLRGNAPSPASLLSLLGLSRWAPATFGPGDPRAALALTPVDPRIHFALNCGAASCPPIRVFVPGRLEAGLTAAAAAFCAGEVEVDVGRGVVTLSSIFKWYGGDFGAKSDLIKFLVGVVPEGTKAQLQEVVSGAGGADKVTLRFAPYDWSTNAVLE